MKFLALFSLVAVAAAAPAALEARGATTCGSTYYSSSQVTAASNAACQYVMSGSTAGGSSYPHEYHNYEGFYFQGLDGPFYEFPLRTSGVYSGGSPGADRVIITEDCEQAGQITHTGAGGNNFVACSGTS
ncbi:guanyl-specific ribonuclease F1 [Nannizzia gypsea CBS 118893]|uniref:ribonuclease T1 n=1 Tax=Arthroderma gypseum (strain ATCC MYA-4604 / CBS 118893) TaxID=535722 RepID=E4UPH6_ARTGP|nr:guanyl-specific ribonuclease F1 [Nannizzia gypsea CBS 118893]EFQ99851.1 guanyl-specific ribonuclease F1 [Nannizzia gypsea CBS 118893]